MKYASGRFVINCYSKPYPPCPPPYPPCPPPYPPCPPPYPPCPPPYPPCPPPYPPCPPPKPDCCIPRRGELVDNGGFEENLMGWYYNEWVSMITPPHEGDYAVALGVKDPMTGSAEAGPGRLEQETSGICPYISYRLSFYINATQPGANAKVRVFLSFLDETHNQIPNSRESITINPGILPGAVMPDYTWNSYQIIAVAPEGARYALITFEISENTQPYEHVHIDDVSLVALG